MSTENTNNKMKRLEILGEIRTLFNLTVPTFSDKRKDDQRYKWYRGDACSDTVFDLLEEYIDREYPEIEVEMIERKHFYTGISRSLVMRFPFNVFE